MKIFGNDGKLIFGDNNVEILNQNGNILEVKVSNDDIFKVNVVGSNSNEVYVDNVVLINDVIIGDKKYKTVKIGNTVWLKENLDYEVENSWYYDNDKVNYGKYGRLYTWDSAMSISVPGWRLPTKSELDDLVMYAGGSTTGGKHLKANSDLWRGTSGAGDDKLGFTAIPLGSRSNDGAFANFFYNCYIWSSTTTSTGAKAYRLNLFGNNDTASVSDSDKDVGRCVRLVKDN